MLLLLVLACGPHLPPEAPPEVEPAAASHIEAVLVAPGEPRRPVRLTVQGERILAVDDLDQPLEGPFVTAGLIDAHAHPMGLARAMATLDLTGVATYVEALERVEAWEGEGWILGRGWDQNLWPDAPEGGWPLAADLEARLPGRPVLLRRVDGHAAWASEAALAEAGVTAETPDPPGGRIHRLPDGRPAGVLVNAAAILQPPEPPPEVLQAQLVEALAVIAGSGLTGVHDMGVDDELLALYERLDEQGALPIRVHAYLSPGTRAAERLLTEGPWGGERLRVVGIKAFADGALGSRGALLSAPYADEPGHSGLVVTPPEELAELATRCLAVGAQLAVHAIGDQGVTHALDAFAAAREAHPDRADLRFRIEHAQVVRPDDIPRFRELNVVASMQPTHATSDMPWAEARLGPERVRWSYAWRSLRDAGVPLAFGSDFPVEGVPPGLGLFAAVTRTDPQGQPEGGWYPGEALGFEEALAAYTAGSAYAVHAESELGHLAPGQLADLTLWSEVGVTPDGEALPPERWQPQGTLVGGRLPGTGP